MEKKKYWTSQRKTQAVLRLLRGEEIEVLSREHEVTVAELTQWRDIFLTHGEMSFRRDSEQSKLDKAQRIIGQLQKHYIHFTCNLVNGGTHGQTDSYTSRFCNFRKYGHLIFHWVDVALY